MKTLLCNFNGFQVWGNGDGSFHFLAPFAVDSDGTGPAHGDKYHQGQTSLRPFLNASEDNYIVLPPMLIRAVRPIVLGCQAFVRRALPGSAPIRAVVGDVSDDKPTRKLGEGSIALACALDVDPDPTTGGSDALFEWTFIPGTPARVGQKTYHLQALGK